MVAFNLICCPLLYMSYMSYMRYISEVELKNKLVVVDPVSIFFPRDIFFSGADDGAALAV